MIKTVHTGLEGIHSPFFYDINSVPQANLDNRIIPVRAGKTVGGTSAINAMMTLRGMAADYDRWGSYFGSGSEWTWDGMLPYFKKAINFVPPDSEVAAAARVGYDASYWGNTSKVYASWPSYQYPGTAEQMEAWEGMPGIEWPSDSGAGQTGVFWYPTYMDPELVERSYARTGHLDSIQRPNYHLMTEAKVKRILFEGTTATAASLTSKSGHNINVTASKEVILAAGTFHSPQILQLSGVGPTALLSAANISTVVDLPGVGQNFQDHADLGLAHYFCEKAWCRVS